MTKNNVLPALVLLPAFFVLHNYNELAGFLPFRTALLSALLIYGILAVIFFILHYRGVSKPAASLNIGRKVSGVDIRHRGHKRRPEEAPHLVSPKLWIRLGIRLPNQYISHD